MPRGIWGLPAVPMHKQNAAGCSVIPLRQASDSLAKKCNPKFEFATVSRIGLLGSLSKQMAPRMSSNRGNVSFPFYGFEHLKAHKR